MSFPNLQSSQFLWLFVALSGGLSGCTGVLSSPSERDGTAAAAGAGSTVGGSGPAGVGVEPGGGPTIPPSTTPGDPMVAVACGQRTAPLPGATPFKRLNKREYVNTMGDLFATGAAVAAQVPDETGALAGFDTDVQALDVTDLHVERYNTVAQQLAAAADFGKLTGCAKLDDACATGFIRDFGQRVYRRPLASDEAQELSDLYAWGKSKVDFQLGMQLVLEELLQAPPFIYRPEFGDPSTLQGGTVALTSWELASRLSYTFLGTMPDAELVNLAASDGLRNRATVREQAARLLASERAKAVVQQFFSQWMQLGDLPNLVRTPATYPGFESATPQLLAQETEAFVNHVMWESDAGLDELLGAPYTYVNKPLATYYGLPAPADGGFVKVANPGKNFGLLTQASFLASHASDSETSPIRRGAFIRLKVMCSPIPDPPASVDTSPPPIDPASTTRERYAQKTAGASCIGCHASINPPGFALEHFDPTGRYREVDNGNPIDDVAALVGSDVDGPIAGVAGLSDALTRSDQVAQCAVLKWANFELGHALVPSDGDACNVSDAYAAFAGSKKNVRELLLALTQTDAFLYRAEVTP